MNEPTGERPFENQKTDSGTKRKCWTAFCLKNCLGSNRLIIEGFEGRFLVDVSFIIFENFSLFCIFSLDFHGKYFFSKIIKLFNYIANILLWDQDFSTLRSKSANKYLKKDTLHGFENFGKGYFKIRSSWVKKLFSRISDQHVELFRNYSIFTVNEGTNRLVKTFDSKTL